MKLKNNSVGPKVIHYVSIQSGRKAVTIEANEIVEINDCAQIINNQEIEHKWVTIVAEEKEIATPVTKMEEATKDVESYMSEEKEEEVTEDSEEKTETKKSTKKK